MIGFGFSIVAKCYHKSRVRQANKVLKRMENKVGCVFLQPSSPQLNDGMPFWSCVFVFTNRKIIGRLKSNKMSMFKLTQAAIINITFPFRLFDFEEIWLRLSSVALLLRMFSVRTDASLLSRICGAFMTKSEQINSLHTSNASKTPKL